MSVIRMSDIEVINYNGIECKEMWYGNQKVWSMIQNSTNRSNYFDTNNQKIGRLIYNTGSKWQPSVTYANRGYRTYQPIYLPYKRMITEGNQGPHNIWVVLYDTNLKVIKFIGVGTSFYGDSSVRYIGAYSTEKSITLNSFVLREYGSIDTTETILNTTWKTTRAYFTNDTTDNAPVLSEPVFSNNYTYSYSKHQGYVNGDSIVLTTKFEYISYVAGSGIRRYVPVREYNQYTKQFNARFGYFA